MPPDLDDPYTLFTEVYLPIPNPVFLAADANVPFLGPFSLLVRTNLAAYSLVKQSQIPSHATIMKSWSGFNATFLISGKEVT